MKTLYLYSFILFFYVINAKEITKAALKPLTPSEAYTNSISFDDDNKEQYVLFWKFNKDEIQLEVHCKTTGWVGLGISPNGGMAGADIIIGWVNSGKPVVKDCYTSTATKPLTDQEQNIVLLDGAEVNGYTIMKYKRKLQTCDENDLDINIGTLYLIGAWNNEDPITGQDDWKYHGPNNRLTKALIMLNYRNERIEDQTVLPSHIVQHELQMPNVTIGAKDTYYYCDLFELPAFDEDMHLIKFEMIINKTSKRFVHHLLGYECETDFIPSEKLARECGAVPVPEVFARNCMAKLMIAWGVGGDYSYSFPKQAGYRFKSSDKKRYMLLEMHYDNPQIESGRVDNSGVRMIFTKQLRQHDLGLLSLNAAVLQIPPNADKIKFSSTCYPECTEKYFPEDGINVVTGLLHTHLAGRKIRTSLVRNNKMIGYLFDNPNYDFNYQYAIDIEPTKLYKGDSLITECTYTTTGRTNFTTFGFGTRDEMCINFVYYYPKIKYFDTCQSHSSPEALFGFYRSLMNEKLIGNISLDEDNFWMSLENVTNFFKHNVSFSSKTIGKFTEFFDSVHNKSLYCGSLLEEEFFTYKRNIPAYLPKEYTPLAPKCPIPSSVPVLKPLSTTLLFILIYFIKCF